MDKGTIYGFVVTAMIWAVAFSNINELGYGMAILPLIILSVVIIVVSTILFD